MAPERDRLYSTWIATTAATESGASDTLASMLGCVDRRYGRRLGGSFIG